METDGLKKTALYDKHLKLKAQMVPFAGWNMPLQYDKITNEHLNVRENAGLFDISHMGKFIIKGKKSLDLLQRLVPKDLSTLPEGKAVYTQFCNPSGGIIDDLIIYRLADQDKTYHFLLIVNASNTAKDYDWVITNQDDTTNITIEDISYSHGLIALQGPNASNILTAMGIKEEYQPKSFHIVEKEIDNEKVLFARTGYTGEDGFEILCSNNFVSTLWDIILEKGKSFNLKPIGIAARDTLRLEAAYPLHGNDIEESTTPIEANLGWSVAKDKSDFIGKDAIYKQIAHGTSKVFIGFKMLSKNIPRKGCEIFQDGRIIGNTTSGSIAPYLNYAIGLGYVDKKSSHEPGSKVEILIRNKKIPAEIVQIPFYRGKRGSKMSKNVEAPENVRCAKSHEYVIVDGDVATIGITDYAASQLGEIVYIELPDIGLKLQKGETFGTIESVKAASELYMPLSGEIIEVNENLTSEPELINEDCFNTGWILKIKGFQEEELEDTLSFDDYKTYTDSED